MTRAFPALALLFVLAAATPASAQDPVAELTKLVKESASTANPTMAVLRGLAAMPDFQLGQADVRRALQATNLPSTSLVMQILSPTQRLVKRGTQVDIQRSQKTTITMEGGQGLSLDRRVKARFRVEGASQATIDDIDGIQVGENATDLYDLKKVKFTTENGRPVAKVTAGAFIFSKTVTIDLSKKNRTLGGPPPASGTVTAAETSSPAPQGRGIISALPNQ